MPILFRSSLYFLYRYILLLGFLDGGKGLIYCYLQGFWYRFLVDAKIMQLKKYSEDNNVSLEQSVKKVLDIDLNSNPQ